MSRSRSKPFGVYPPTSCCPTTQSMRVRRSRSGVKIGPPCASSRGAARVAHHRHSLSTRHRHPHRRPHPHRHRHRHCHQRQRQRSNYPWSSELCRPRCARPTSLRPLTFSAPPLASNPLMALGQARSSSRSRSSNATRHISTTGSPSPTGPPRVSRRGVRSVSRRGVS